MAITRWDPLRDVLTLQNRMNSLFQDFSRAPGDNDPLTPAGFAPPVDIYEDPQKVVLKLEIPGIRQEDLDISIENNTLTVRGERKLEKDEREENFHRIERRYGSFYRAFTIPSTIDASNVKADYESGVLRLELQKRPESKPRQIKVSIGSKIEGASRWRALTRKREELQSKHEMGSLEVGFGVSSETFRGFFFKKKPRSFAGTHAALTTPDMAVEEQGRVALGLCYAAWFISP